MGVRFVVFFCLEIILSGPVFYSFFVVQRIALRILSYVFPPSLLGGGGSVCSECGLFSSTSAFSVPCCPSRVPSPFFCFGSPFVLSVDCSPLRPFFSVVFFVPFFGGVVFFQVVLFIFSCAYQ